MTTTTNIIVLGSKPYPKIRRVRKKNKRTKNTHFQRSSYVRQKKRTNGFYSIGMMSSCSLSADRSHGFITYKPFHNLTTVLELAFCENDPLPKTRPQPKRTKEFIDDGLSLSFSILLLTCLRSLNSGLLQLNVSMLSFNRIIIEGRLVGLFFGRDSSRCTATIFNSIFMCSNVDQLP